MVDHETLARLRGWYAWKDLFERERLRLGRELLRSCGDDGQIILAEAISLASKCEAWNRIPESRREELAYALERGLQDWRAGHPEPFPRFDVREALGRLRARNGTARYVERVYGKPVRPTDRQKEAAAGLSACVGRLEEFVPEIGDAVASRMNGEGLSHPEAVEAVFADLVYELDRDPTPTAGATISVATSHYAKALDRGLGEFLDRVISAPAPAGWITSAVSEPSSDGRGWFRCSKAEVLRAFGKSRTHTKYIDKLVMTGRMEIVELSDPVGWEQYEVRFNDPDEHDRIVKAIEASRDPG